jgi:hypothetical protein
VRKQQRVRRWNRRQYDAQGEKLVVYSCRHGYAHRAHMFCDLAAQSVCYSVATTSTPCAGKAAAAGYPATRRLVPMNGSRSMVRIRQGAFQSGVGLLPCGWPASATLAVRLADAHVPWLLPQEFTNVLRTACRRGSLPAARAREIVDQVGLLPIRIDPTPPAPAALLSLALRLHLPIATRDADLAEAAWAAGVGVVPG